MGLRGSKRSDAAPILAHKSDDYLDDENKDGGSGKPSTTSSTVSNNGGASNTEEIRVYKRRFYILALYSIASVFQILFWNTWSPIADTAMAVFGWDTGDIALIAMWGGIISAFCCIPFAGFMDKYGMRKVFLLAETFALIGVAIRCIPVQPESMFLMANIGQFFIALAGPFLVQAPPLISVTWFPPHQRTTATAVATISMEAGHAMSFLFGPMMVKEPKVINSTLIVNQTNDLQTNLSSWDISDEDNLAPEVRQEHIDDIYHLLYIHLGLIVFIYILAWVYFPTKPPTPPSVSASTKREDFIPGAKILVRSYNNFWLPAICYGISLGVFGSWSNQLDIYFSGTLGRGQDFAAWVAFYTYCAGTAGGFIFGRCGDYLGNRKKIVILAVTGPCIGFFVWFLLLCYEAININDPSIYISCVTCGFLLNSAKPLYLEAICEGVYPVGEGITIGFLNWLSNCIGLTFLFVMMIPGIGVYWMNWAVLGAIIATFLIMTVFKEHNKRLTLDRGATFKDIQNLQNLDLSFANPGYISKNESDI